MTSPPLTADGFKKLALVLLLAAVAFLCLAIDDAGGVRIAVPRRYASEETRPVLRAPSGRDRTGPRKRLLGGVNYEATD